MTGEYSKSASGLAAARVALTEEVIATELCLEWRTKKVQVVFTSRCHISSCHVRAG